MNKTNDADRGNFKPAVYIGEGAAIKSHICEDVK